MDLRLPPTHLSWIWNRLGGNPAEDDLVATYGFDHPLNARQAGWVLSLNEDRLTWHVALEAPTGELLTPSGICRDALPAVPLRSNEDATGHVVYNRYFEVDEAFREHGVARAAYSSEETLHKKWNIDEVHLDAKDDGRAVWIQKFGFCPVDADLLLAEFQRRFPAATVPAVNLLPAEFLCSYPQLPLYRVVER